MLDAHRLRADFAVFDELVNGKPVAFLDSAASSQKPRQVLDAMREFYEHSYANVHRGVYQLAERATAGYEGARQKIRAFINAPEAREIVFTRNATEDVRSPGGRLEHFLEIPHGDERADDRRGNRVAHRGFRLRREERHR